MTKDHTNMTIKKRLRQVEVGEDDQIKGKYKTNLRAEK